MLFICRCCQLPLGDIDVPSRVSDMFRRHDTDLYRVDEVVIRGGGSLASRLRGGTGGGDTATPPLN